MRIKVSGMMCMHCVKSVERACRSVDGVTDCVVSLEGGFVDVSGNADVDEVIRAIDDQGFTATAE